MYIVYIVYIIYMYVKQVGIHRGMCKGCTPPNEVSAAAYGICAGNKFAAKLSCSPQEYFG